MAATLETDTRTGRVAEHIGWAATGEAKSPRARLAPFGLSHSSVEHGGRGREVSTSVPVQCRRPLALYDHTPDAGMHTLSPKPKRMAERMQHGMNMSMRCAMRELTSTSLRITHIHIHSTRGRFAAMPQDPRPSLLPTTLNARSCMLHEFMQHGHGHVTHTLLIQCLTSKGAARQLLWPPPRGATLPPSHRPRLAARPARAPSHPNRRRTAYRPPRWPRSACR